MKNNQKACLIGAFMLARGVSRRGKVQTANILAIRTLRRMFPYIEFSRALGRSEALVTRMGWSYGVSPCFFVLFFKVPPFPLPDHVTMVPKENKNNAYEKFWNESNEYYQESMMDSWYYCIFESGLLYYFKQFINNL